MPRIYLVYTDVTWKFQTKQLTIRSCGLLAKLKYYVIIDILKTVYFLVIRYSLQVWRQKQSTTLNDTQNKASTTR